MPTLDLIGGIALTASAATTVATLALAYPAPGRTQARIAIGFAVWLALLVTFTALDVFHPENGIGTPGLGLALLLPMAVMIVLVARSPERRQAVFAIPVSTLIGYHAIRILGVFFILLLSAGRLPVPFAPIAGWGDIFIGVTALPVAWMVRSEIGGWRSIAIVWSLLGALDLIAAIVLGVTSAPDSPLRLFYGDRDAQVMTTLPWIIIPAFLVPTLFLTHVVALRRLFGDPARGSAEARMAPG